MGIELGNFLQLFPSFPSISCSTVRNKYFSDYFLNLKNISKNLDYSKQKKKCMPYFSELLYQFLINFVNIH